MDRDGTTKVYEPQKVGSLTRPVCRSNGTTSYSCTSKLSNPGCGSQRGEDSSSLSKRRSDDTRLRPKKGDKGIYFYLFINLRTPPEKRGNFYKFTKRVESYFTIIEIKVVKAVTMFRRTLEKSRVINEAAN